MGIWIANSGSGNKSQPAPSYTPPPSYTSPASAAAPSPAPAPVVPVSDEQKPPEGRNNVLNIPQIRWCKREKIRIEAIESVINNAYDHEVDRFNAKVADYNSRCGEFRYRRGNVEQVDRELAPESSSIATKTKSEWLRNSLGLKDGPAPAPAPKKEKPLALAKDKPVPGKTCQSDGECPGSQYCVLGHCGLQVKTGGTCGRSTECSGLSSQCISGRCVGDDGGGPVVTPERKVRVGGCQSDGECSGSLYCVMGKCSPQVGTGGTCERSTECAGLSSQCISGKCVGDDGGVAKSPVAAPRQPSTTTADSLSYAERESIESTCSYNKTTNGPAAYNRCVSEKVAELKSSPRNIDLSGLSSMERQSVENTCSYNKTTNGPAAYNRCVSEQISRLRK
jgi:hypothetical protein